MAAWLVCKLWDGGRLASQAPTEARGSDQAGACIGLCTSISSMPLQSFLTGNFGFPDYIGPRCTKDGQSFLLIRAMSFVDAFECSGDPSMDPSMECTLTMTAPRVINTGAGAG